MTVTDLKTRVCDIIDLYADHPEAFYEAHRRPIDEFTRIWGTEVFLGALRECCAGASLPYFFTDAAKWREIYLVNRRLNGAAPNVSLERLFESLKTAYEGAERKTLLKTRS